MLSLFRAALVTVLAATTVPVFAGPQAGAPVAHPNVIVVKVPLDQNGHEQSKGAELIPLKIKLKVDTGGHIDFAQLVRDADADAKMPRVSPVSLVINGFDGESVPAIVRHEWEHVDQASTVERLSWRLWTNWGAIGNSGFYGYGYSPGYGYNPELSCYGNYGYYYGGYTYPFAYGYYRTSSGYGLSYYYR